MGLLVSENMDGKCATKDITRLQTVMESNSPFVMKVSKIQSYLFKLTENRFTIICLFIDI